MELEVGMYTYSKQSRDYGIGKIVKIHTNGFTHSEVEIQYKNVKISTRYDYVVGSHNIIDLIEVGDILEINNEKYEVIYDKSYEKLGILIPSREELSIRHSALEYVFKKYKVSIVTKEQFESMSYKVEE